MALASPRASRQCARAAGRTIRRFQQTKEFSIVRRFTTLLAAAVVAAGCFDDNEPNAPNYQFEVEPFPLGVENLPQDSWVLVEATVTNLTTGNEVPDPTVAYFSDDPSVAVVEFIDPDNDPETDAVQAIVGVGPGETIIRARFRTAEVEIPVEVIAVPITSGALTADRTTAFVGEEIELEAVFRNGAGIIVTRPVEFSSDDEDVATVDEDGVVTVTGPGTATITATSDGFDATIVVTGELRAVETIVVTPDGIVVDVGDTREFTATLLADNDEELGGREVVWSSSDATKATVDAATGIVTAVAPTGNVPVIISATSEGVTGRARLFVGPAQ
jgi:hypothetical protein